jgi:glycosyltransferase involved in cell wall biosynthesis
MAGQRSIAFLLDSSVPNWSSQEDRHLRLCQALLMRGVRPLLVFATPLERSSRERFEAAGVTVGALDYSKGLSSYRRGLNQLITTHQVTTVHVIFFDYFSAVPWLCRLGGVRHIVYEAQNSGVLKATGWKKQVLRARTRLMTRPIHRVIAISRYVAAQLVEAGVPASKITVRYLGVDPFRFAPGTGGRAPLAKFAIKSGEAVVTTISYLRPFKNAHIILEACALLKQRGCSFRLFVAGDGELKPQLEQLGNTLQIREQVHWLGAIDRSEWLLQASDIFVLASTGEAFGLVFTEAMGCGVPPIGSRSGATAEVIDDGETGLLATPLSPTSFADAIERLITDPELRRAMGERARKRVLTHFNIERAVEETVAVYDQLWTPIDDDHTPSGDL